MAPNGWTGVHHSCLIQPGERRESLRSARNTEAVGEVESESRRLATAKTVPGERLLLPECSRAAHRCVGLAIVTPPAFSVNAAAVVPPWGSGLGPSSLVRHRDSLILSGSSHILRMQRALNEMNLRDREIGEQLNAFKASRRAIKTPCRNPKCTEGACIRTSRTSICAAISTVDSVSILRPCLGSAC